MDSHKLHKLHGKLKTLSPFVTTDQAMWRQISDSLLDRLKESEAVKDQVTRLETQVWGGEITAGRAADEVLGRFFGAGGR